MNRPTKRRFGLTLLLPLLLPALLALSACGFHLRGQYDLAFQRLYLDAKLPPAIATTLQRSLRSAADVELVSDPKRADAIVEILGETRSQQILSLTAQGTIRQYRLNLTFRFRVTDAQGNELIPATAIEQYRDVSTNDAAVLAKEAEDALLYRDMQVDAIRQLVRRLATVKPLASAASSPQP